MISISIIYKFTFHKKRGGMGQKGLLLEKILEFKPCHGPRCLKYHLQQYFQIQMACQDSTETDQNCRLTSTQLQCPKLKCTLKLQLKETRWDPPATCTEDCCIMTFKFIDRWSNSTTCKISTIEHVNCIISRTESKATKNMRIQKANKLFQ